MSEYLLKYKPKRLPHWDYGEAAQMITYRLADPISEEEYELIQNEAKALPFKQRDRHMKIRVENNLHEARYGSCCLNNPIAAKIVIDAWYYFAGTRYDLYEWVVMGNHIHVLIRQFKGFSLGKIIGSWKSYTSKKISQQLNIPQPVWKPEYWDRMIRDEDHFQNAKYYILNNPIKSGIVNWPYVSTGSFAPE
ncbi:MAG: transposase [Planctomycetia bacterium]|nr:transposase [Planctomycetia bacterium]